MKKINPSVPYKTEQGFSLIEVLVAMAIGIILLGAVSYLFLGSKQLNRNQNETSRMQENGRYALDTMGRVIRQAGARRNIDALNPDAETAYSLIATAISFTEGATTPDLLPDTVTVSYYTQNANEVDCNGNTLATDTLVTFNFAVDTTTKQLTCSNGTAAAVAIVDGVENMKVSIALDTSVPPDAVIDSYVTPNNVPARSASLEVWRSHIAAVNVSLLLRSASDTLATNKQTYTFNSTATTATDLRLRQVYNVTYNLRNLTR